MAVNQSETFNYRLEIKYINIYNIKRKKRYKEDLWTRIYNLKGLCTHWQVPGVMHVPLFSSQPGAQIAVKKKFITFIYIFFFIIIIHRAITYILFGALFNISRREWRNRNMADVASYERGSDVFFFGIKTCVSE